MDHILSFPNQTADKLMKLNTHKKAISQSHTGSPSDLIHWISISGTRTLHKHTTDKFQSMASCHVTPKDSPVLQTKWRRRIVEQCHRLRGCVEFPVGGQGRAWIWIFKGQSQRRRTLGVSLLILLFGASSFRPPSVVIFVIVYCSRG